MSLVEASVVYKRGKYYWFKFQWKRQMLYFSTGQGDARIAANLESKKRVELAENRGGIKKRVEPPTLRRYLHDNIIPWAEAQYSGKPKTLKWYRNEARVLCDYKPLADAKLDAIKATSLTGFKAARLKQGRAIATVNSTIRALRAVLNHAVEDGVLDIVPKFKILKGANVRSWILSTELEPKYLDACTEPLRTVGIIILDAGLRPDECFRLKWDNVRRIDQNRAVLIVPGTKTEAASRIVPMTPRVRAILQSRWENAGKPTGGWIFPAKKASVGHIVPNTIYQPHLDAVANSGICDKQFVLYALRHTCLSRWGASGMDAWTLARLAGHSNIKQSMTYVHPTDKSLHAAIDRMSAQGGDEIEDNAENALSATETKLLVSTTK
jgi:integrase